MTRPSEIIFGYECVKARSGSQFGASLRNGLFFRITRVKRRTRQKMLIDRIDFPVKGELRKVMIKLLQ